MKKIVIFLLILLFACSLPVAAWAQPLYNSELEVNSEILYLKSMDDGTVIFSQNADMPCQPAGLLNIVAAMIVLNNVPDPETQTFTVPENINSILAGTDSAVMLFKGGDKIRVIDLLYCILIRSAADASMTLAYGVAGSEEEFVRMMNEYVRELGCGSTNFVNVTGLDADGQYTTAADMAIIMQKAAESKTFREISTQGTYDFPATEKDSERRVYTTNLMLQSGYPSYYYRYLTAAKSGATEGAGRCVAVTAARDGYSYVAVVMKGAYVDTNNDGNKENYAFIDCKQMLSWTFSNIKLRTVTNETQTVAELPVKYSFKTDHIRLVPAERLSVLLPDTADTESVVFHVLAEDTKTELTAPVKKGEPVGKAEVLYGEQVIATVGLVAAEDIPFDLPGFAAGLLKDIFTSPAVIVILLIIIAVGVVYFALGVRYDKKLGRFRIMRGGKTAEKTTDRE
ncbi:MAG: D-alanyl-D-alanine carboxypeptidase [Clostridia bacterium]|nr:D-alanyl-D-alanine carboxypeptidase [Clostridia bacterium]